MTTNPIPTDATDDMLRRKIIAAQNDLFRRQDRRITIPGKLVMTAGIDALRLDRKIDTLIRVRDFNRFDEANDPYGEHDFGALEVAHVGKVFWKIEYFDADYQFGSDDPTDLTRTKRVLTIMLASEY